jgi:hypothetical protein
LVFEKTSTRGVLSPQEVKARNKESRRNAAERRRISPVGAIDQEVWVFMTSAYLSSKALTSKKNLGIAVFREMGGQIPVTFAPQLHLCKSSRFKIGSSKF